MALTLNKVHHFGILVTDLDRTVAFYNALFGKEPKKRAEVSDNSEFDAQMEAQNAHAKIAFYEIGDVAVEFIQVLSPVEAKVQPSTHTPGSKHLCFFTEDIQETYDQLKATGIDFVAPPALLTQPPMEGTKFAYFHDPDGNILELMEDPSKKSLISKLVS